MSLRTCSFAALCRGLGVLAGFTLLAGCGGGSNGTTNPPTTSPAITLSSTSLTFASQFQGNTSDSQFVTVSNPGTALLNFSAIAASGDFAETNTCGNGLAPGNVCQISVTFKPTAAGTRAGNVTLTDDASGSPHMVSLSGTGTSVSVSPASLTFTGDPVGSAGTAQPVTLTNTSSTALAVSGISVTTATADFAQTNNCGLSVAAGASCTINVTYTAPATGTIDGILTITDNSDGAAGSTQTVALSGLSSGSNTLPVGVNFGPGGFSTTSNSYYNGIFTTVNVCEPGSNTCASVPNVLVDTGSTGLRLLASTISTLNLPQATDSTGNPLYECLEFGSLAYTWGPMAMARVQLGGETARHVPAAAGGTPNAGIPIQVIYNGGSAPFGAPCLNNSIGAYNSVTSLGANGILGVGNAPQDCGAGCTTSAGSVNVSPYPYITCPSNGGVCALSLVPVSSQAWNPVAAFPNDNNGLALNLPSVPAGGAPSVQGTLTFGIGTDINNAIPGSASIYEIDPFGDFQSLVYNGVTYTSDNSFGSFLDSGSNSLFISDPATLSSATGSTVTNCADNGYYCVTPTPLGLDITVSGSNGVTSPTETLTIENADSLLNSTNAALNNLAAGSGGNSVTTDSWDLGLPFFFGRTIFVGIAGATNGAPNSASGYWAF